VLRGWRGRGARDCLGVGILGMGLVMGIFGFLCDFWYFSVFSAFRRIYGLQPLLSMSDFSCMTWSYWRFFECIDEIVVRSWNAYFVCATSCLYEPSWGEKCYHLSHATAFGLDE